MAHNFLAWELLVLQERVRLGERRLERRQLRDAQNPYTLPIDEFMDEFWISPDLAMELTEFLRPFLQRQRENGLSPEIQVLVAVHFYANGSYQRVVGNRFDLNVCQSSVSRCIHVVTDLINQRLLRRWVKFPMTPQERAAAKSKFLNAPQPFGGAIGAIDCTFINILGPREHEEAFVNHHGNHSLNVQATVDPDLKLLNINARYPGARNDSYIWSASPIRRAMEFHYNRGERGSWLIGDAGYPLEPWLMTPLPHYPDGTRQFQYTEQLCKARNVVERFFGCFKGMWRCMSYQRVLMYDPATAGKIVNACAVLHNMRIHHRLPIGQYDDVAEADPLQNDDRIPVQREPEGGARRGPRAIAQRVQRQIMRERFPELRDADGEEIDPDA